MRGDIFFMIERGGVVCGILLCADAAHCCISIVGFGGFENIFAGGRRVLQVICVCGEWDMKNNFQQPPKTSQSQIRDSKVRLTFDAEPTQRKNFWPP